MLLLTVIYLTALAIQVGCIYLLKNANLSFQYSGHHRYLRKHEKKPL